MCNETYDDYIRSILGYSERSQYDSYNQSYQDYRSPTFNTNINISGNNIDLENSYPEIYKIVYPMVSKKCENVRMDSFSRDDIDNMVDEIYYALEEKQETRVNINLTNDTSNMRTTNNTKMQNKKPEVNVSESNGKETENRQFNTGLRDLIQILLIRELLNRPRPPFRPPMPNPPGPGPRPPMRPPFRPGPGRPPFNRGFGNFEELYEQF